MTCEVDAVRVFTHHTCDLSLTDLGEEHTKVEGKILEESQRIILELRASIVPLKILGTKLH